MPSTNEITSETIISSDELSHLLVDPDILYIIARNFASHPTSTATLRHYRFLSLSIDRLELDLERHRLEQQVIFTYLMESRTFRTKIQPIVEEYRRKAHLMEDRRSSYPFSLSPFNNHVNPPPTVVNMPRDPELSELYMFNRSGHSSLTSHQTTTDEEIMMVGSLTNIVVDKGEVEGSKSNPIMVHDSNDEPENGGGLIRNDKDVCARCDRQGHQQEDCGTPMRSFQHCPICAWTKQASCTHVDVSPAWLKELRTNFEKRNH